MTTATPSAESPGPSSPPAPDSQLHDSGRIRGQALRTSLYFTLIAWIPGAFWQSATAGAPAIKLGEYLGANDFIFSLLAAAPLVGILFQIPGSVISDWLGRRKKLFIWTVTPHRALYILIGLLPWIMPRQVAWPALLMAFLILISMALNNLGGQAWSSWMADLVPARIRGKYFGRRSKLGIGVSAITALFIALILDFSHQAWFDNLFAPATRWAGMPPLILLISLIFMLAGVIGMLDILSYLRVDEPPMKAIPREPVLSRLLKPLRDPAFRRFVVYWSGWNIAYAFTGWLWYVYILDYLTRQRHLPVHSWWADHMYVAATVILTVSFQCGNFMGYTIWGRAVDRFGSKPVLFISSTLHTVGWIWWIFLGPTLLPWLMLTQMFSGFASGGQDIASFNMMLQFNRRGGTAYQALGSVIFGIAGALGALAAGSLATALQGFHYVFAQGTSWEHSFNHYPLIIIIGVFLKYAADLLLLPRVIDPGNKPTTHALRFVFDNMYGNLNTLIFAPLKTGVVLTNRGLSGVRGTLTDAGTGIRRWWR